MVKIYDRLHDAAADTTPSLAIVGQWMVSHPIQLLAQSAEEIAEVTGTSVAAVNRFSRAAGFKGFADLKSQLGVEMQSVMAPIQKLGSDSSAGLPKFSGGLSPDLAPVVARIAGRLSRARRVMVLGFGASSYAAGYAEHVLTPFISAVTAVAGFGGTEAAARRIATCRQGDVVLALSLPRYSRDTPRLAQFAKGRGAHIAAITGSAESSLAKVADDVLVISCDHPVLPSSITPMIVAIETIAGDVARLNPDALRLARELVEPALTHLE